jgi:hypothetical protein
MSRSWRTSRSTLLAASVLLSMQACDRTPKGADTAQARAKKPDPAAVAALAKSYDFVDPAAPVDAVTPLPDGTAVPEGAAPTVLTIARAVPTASPAPSGEVILALVNSNKAYPPLGIEVGDNWIWRNQADADPKKWDTYMVPAAAGSDPKKLKRDNKEYSNGSHEQPRLVRSINKAVLSFGACLDDPACGSGHCGYGDLDRAVRE